MPQEARVSVTPAPEPRTAQPAATADHERIVVPPIDIVETQTAFEIIVDMPGADASTIDVVAGRNMLTLEGRWAVTAPRAHAQIKAEFVPCTYRCELGLNDKIAQEHIKAEFKDGVLRVTLPKAHGALTRRIDVAGA